MDLKVRKKRDKKIITKIMKKARNMGQLYIIDPLFFGK